MRLQLNSWTKITFYRVKLLFNLIVQENVDEMLDPLGNLMTIGEIELW